METDIIIKLREHDAMTSFIGSTTAVLSLGSLIINMTPDQMHELHFMLDELVHMK